VRHHAAGVTLFRTHQGSHVLVVPSVLTPTSSCRELQRRQPQGRIALAAFYRTLRGNG
jgi:hypothetical protein